VIPINVALGSPVRIAILRHIPVVGTTPTEMAETIGVSLPTASRHLLVLAEAGILKVRRSGRHRVYSPTVRRIEIILPG
jgi:DNA-binding transcriptional ArsR family regulator